MDDRLLSTVTRSLTDNRRRSVGRDDAGRGVRVILASVSPAARSRQ